MFTRPIRHIALALIVSSVLAVPAGAEDGMTLVTASFTPGGTLAARQVLNGFGCTGGNLSPSLAWSGAPDGTKSYVITMRDPDAPTGSGFWHWSMFNIPASVTELPEGLGAGAPVPEGSVLARNDLSQNAYAGACPPEGAPAHRYVFTIYAMPEASLPLDATASSALVSFFAINSSLASASLTATFGR